MEYTPHHTAISVRSLDKTKEFYQAFGFKQVHRYDDKDKVGVKLRLKDYILELFVYKKNADAMPLELDLGNDLPELGVKHIGFTVDNLDASLENLKSKGLVNEETRILSKETARFFFVKDPDGMWVEVIKDDRY